MYPTSPADMGGSDGGMSTLDCSTTSRNEFSVPDLTATGQGWNSSGAVNGWRLIQAWLPSARQTRSGFRPMTE